MMWKVVANNHLFVFWNGWLIYKRWLNRGWGVVSDPYGIPFRPRDGHRDRENPNEKVGS